MLKYFAWIILSSIALTFFMFITGPWSKFWLWTILIIGSLFIGAVAAEILKGDERKND